MYRFEMGGKKIECDNADELHAALATNGHTVTRSADDVNTEEPPASKTGSGQAAAWAAAKELAEREGISVAKARAKLAKQKKQAAA